MKDNLYVIGHKNPDTDSICSALAYAEMKRRIGENAIACRLGPLNEETKFILKKFDVENPLLLKDARSQLKDIVMDTPNFKVIIPKTEESACLYGTGTKWCTTAEKDNKFDSYNKQGDLYIILTKIDGKDRKFQFHYESDSFMDERNQELPRMHHLHFVLTHIFVKKRFFHF